MKQSQGAAGGVSRTEGGKPCMRNEPGEANPGCVDSCCLHAEGAENLEGVAGCLRQAGVLRIDLGQWR
jgi:hypothetical protein